MIHNNPLAMADKKETANFKEQRKEIYAKIYERFHSKLWSLRENHPQQKAVFRIDTPKGVLVKIMDLEFLFQSNGKIKLQSGKAAWAKSTFLTLYSEIGRHFSSLIEDTVFPVDENRPTIPDEIDLLIPAATISEFISRLSSALECSSGEDEDHLAGIDFVHDEVHGIAIQCEDPVGPIRQFIKEHPKTSPSHEMIKLCATNLARIRTFNKARGHAVHKLKGGGAFGMPLLRLAKYAAVEFIRATNQEALRLTWLSDVSRNATITRYNQVVRFLPLYRQVSMDAPSLLTFFDLTLSRLGREERNEWIRDPLFVLHNLRRYWINKGLSKAGWRLISQCSITEMKTWMMWFRKNQEQFIFLANLCPPRQIPATATGLSILHEFKERKELQIDRFPQFIETFLRSYAALPRGRKEEIKFEREDRKRSLRDAFSDIADYLASIEDGETPMPTVPQNAGLNWWTRQQQAWHVDIAIRHAKKTKRRNKSWTSLVMEHRNDSFAACALTTSVDLIIEGDLMSHCVGGYDRYCSSGSARIFSIRRGEERIATLELTFDPQINQWAIAQLRGKYNRAVDDAVWAFAKEIVDAYTSAWKSTRQELAA